MAGQGDRFAGGALFVGLDSIRDAALVPAAIAQALGLRDEGARPLAATLVEWLHPLRLLLVLDNFEQVIEATALAGELLSRCPTLLLLVTSRVPLHLRAEHQVPVEPLPLPIVSAKAAVKVGPNAAKMPDLEAIAAKAERGIDQYLTEQAGSHGERTVRTAWGEGRAFSITEAIGYDPTRDLGIQLSPLLAEAPSSICLWLSRRQDPGWIVGRRQRGATHAERANSDELAALQVVNAAGRQLRRLGRGGRVHDGHGVLGPRHARREHVAEGMPRRHKYPVQLLVSSHAQGEALRNLRGEEQLEFASCHRQDRSQAPLRHADRAAERRRWNAGRRGDARHVCVANERNEGINVMLEQRLAEPIDRGNTGLRGRVRSYQVGVSAQRRGSDGDGDGDRGDEGSQAPTGLSHAVATTWHRRPPTRLSVESVGPLWRLGR